MEAIKKKIEFWSMELKPQADTHATKEAELTEEMEQPSEGKRPQDDIPTEVIIHYIVKDYRRMFEKCERLNPKIKKYREKIVELTHMLRRRQVEQMTDEKTKYVMESLYKRIDALNEKVSTLTKERDEVKEKCKRLTSQIEDARSSRDAVVESVTEDLEKKLDEANNRIKLLAQAVVEPGKADSVFLQKCTVHTIETDDDKKWMAGAMKQLEKAAMKLLSVEERMVKVEETLKDSVTGIDITKALKNFGKVVNNITSTVSHIECFMDKVGEINITNDDKDN